VVPTAAHPGVIGAFSGTVVHVSTRQKVSRGDALVLETQLRGGTEQLLARAAHPARRAAHVPHKERACERLRQAQKECFGGLEQRFHARGPANHVRAHDDRRQPHASLLEREAQRVKPGLRAPL
jgi:hypothetical protein